MLKWTSRGLQHWGLQILHPDKAKVADPFEELLREKGPSAFSLSIPSL